MKSRVLEFLTVVAVTCVTLIFIHENYLMPRKLIKDSISPDSLSKVEFVSRGYWGTSSIAITSGDSSKTTTTIYSESGNEVIFPGDLNIFWSKDSSIFLAVSERISSIPSQLKKSPSIKLKSGENLVLMYDIPNKTLRHNLYPQSNSPATQFQVNDIKQIEWMNCNVCR
jgi:hypothetical protein